MAYSCTCCRSMNNCLIKSCLQQLYLEKIRKQLFSMLIPVIILVMTNSCANAVNYKANAPNSIAKVTKHSESAMNCTANGTKSTVKETNSIT